MCFKAVNCFGPRFLIFCLQKVRVYFIINQSELFLCSGPQLFPSTLVAFESPSSVSKIKPFQPSLSGSFSRHERLISCFPFGSNELKRRREFVKFETALCKLLSLITQLSQTKTTLTRLYTPRQIPGYPPTFFLVTFSSHKNMTLTSGFLK